MPQWAGSSWYYLRYIDPTNNGALIDLNKEKDWMPVDVYVGGDHATRHLIYARFWHKFLFDIGVVSGEEPFPRLEFLGFILASDGRKMSKRWGNIVNPDDVINIFGADAFRLYEMFIGPFEATAKWDNNGMVGTRRFIERVWRFVNKAGLNENEPLLGSSGRPILGSTRPSSSMLFSSSPVLHKTIKKVTQDIEEFKFNTAVSALMICLNGFEKSDSVSVDDIKIFLQLLAPFAPHMTEELWHALGETESIHVIDWPKYDESKIIDSEFTIAIQVNGKVRDEIVIGADVGEDEVKQIALASEKVQKWINADGSSVEVKKIIYIKNKLISIVL
jgi:leucyl-tRNA synthetase